MGDLNTDWISAPRLGATSSGLLGVLTLHDHTKQRVDLSAVSLLRSWEYGGILV